MEVIREQIKSGKVSGTDLLNFFSSGSKILEFEDEVKKITRRDFEVNEIYKILVNLLKSDSEKLCEFAIILYRSDRVNLFKQVYGEIVKNNNIKRSDNFLICTYLWSAINNFMIIRERRLYDFLTIYLSHTKINPDNKWIIEQTNPIAFNYNSLYALYMMSDQIYLIDLLNREKGYFATLKPSPEIIKLVINNKHEKFFKIMNYYSDLKNLSNYLKISILKQSNLKLIGPVSLSKHSSFKYNKTIYTFGDQHVIEPKCKEDSKNNYIDIVDFIQLTIEQFKDKKIDIFIENPLEKENLNYVKNDNYIYKLYNSFSDCFDKNCKYTNARFHNADPRQDIEMHDIFSAVSRILEGKTNLRGLRTDLHIINIWLNNEKIFENVINRKTTKQISNVRDKDVLSVLTYHKNWVLNYFKTNIMATKFAIQTNIKDFLKTIYTNRNLSESFKNQLESFSILLMQTSNLEMDLYLLGRVFRTFGTEAESQNIIIYTGDAHSNIYRSVLAKLGFLDEGYIKREQPGKDGFQCLNISKFKLPFFT